MLLQRKEEGEIYQELLRRYESARDESSGRRYLLDSYLCMYIYVYTDVYIEREGERAVWLDNQFVLSVLLCV